MNLHHRPRAHGPALEPQRAGDGEAGPGGEAPCPACRVQVASLHPEHPGVGWHPNPGRGIDGLCSWLFVGGQWCILSGGGRDGGQGPEHFWGLGGGDRTGREAGPALRVLGDLCDVSFLPGVHSPRYAIPARLFLILLKQKS